MLWVETFSTMPLVLTISLFQLGRGMTLLGLLGLGSFWGSRHAKPPQGPVGESQIWIMNLTKLPLTIVGVIGAVIWIIAALR
jgi:hypothetical protein